MFFQPQASLIAAKHQINDHKRKRKTKPSQLSNHSIFFKTSEYVTNMPMPMSTITTHTNSPVDTNMIEVITDLET